MIGFEEGARAFVTAHYQSRFAMRGWPDGDRIHLRMIRMEPHRSEVEEQLRAAVAARPDVMLVAGVQNAQHLKSLTKDLPIVFMEVSSPVEAGLVASLRRPGGNVTGASSRSVELIGKRFELLHELAPHARRVTLLMHEGGFSVYPRKEFLAPARALGLVLEEVVATADLAGTTARLAASRPQSCYCFLGFEGSSLMASTLNESRIPAVYFHHKLVEEHGALASLGEWWLDPDNRAIDLAARVLAGEAPADLPVDQLSRPHLAIHVGCARRIGVQVPGAVLLRAQQLIQ